MLSTSKALFRNPAAGGGGTTDPYFPYVPLLLETTSTNGQQNNTFLDSGTANGGVGFTITRNGTPTQGSITPYWPNGQWSNYFNGSTDWLGASPNTVSVLNFGTNPYTVEFWLYGLSKTANQMILRAQNATGSLQIYIDTSGIINFGPQNSAVTITIPSANWNINTWNHIAFSRVGTGSNQLTVYVNGVSIASATDSFNYTITGIDIGAGTNFAGGYYLNGYVSNLRTVNGRAVYTGAFTPPTSPLTATTGGTNPPTGTQCTLLTCYSNRLIDANTAVAAKTFTVNGTPRVQAFQPFSPTASYTTALYGGSGYFNGTSDYVSAARQSAFLLGTNNFTIEFWVYFNSVASAQTVAGSHVTTAAGDWAIYTASTGSLNYYLSSTGATWNIANQVSIGSISVGTWYHVALVRNGSVFTPYLNGVAGTTTTSSASLFASSAPVTVAAANNSLTYFNGYVSNFRMVNGTAIVPPAGGPTTPVTNVTNTSLLLNMTNAGIYDATTQNVVTTVGDAQASTTQPKWSPTSMKFDGTGDWLTLPVNSADTLGSGNWTIEGWFYFSSVSGNLEIFSKESLSSDGIRCVLVSSKVNLSLSSNGTAYATTVVGGTTIATGTWYYLAFTRSANTITIYLNGTSDGTGTFTGALYETNTFWSLASRGGAGTPFNGYIQDFRVTKSVARTITTPTAAFPTR